MIISTPEELRLYLPTHVLDDIANVAGAIDNSVHDFLRERLGAPLLACIEKYYADRYLDADGDPDLDTIQDEIITGRFSASTDTDTSNAQTIAELIRLCQRCVVFDAFARMADIQTLSVHDAGINVVETKGYDSAPDKTIANYKAQMVKEAHAASNRLLIWLEEAQQSVLNSTSTSTDSTADSTTDSTSSSTDSATTGTDTDLSTQSDDDATIPSESSEGSPTNSDSDDDEETVAQATAPTLSQVIQYWKQSQYYYYADGLLFNTATEFGLYVNIYESREKFIQLLPDIRYCQETHLEAELGEALLQDLINKHKAGSLSTIEAKAYTKLQRTLSLMVEARSSLFKRAEAKDESTGQLHLALDYISRNQSSFDATAMATSPLYVPTIASVGSVAPTTASGSAVAGVPSGTPHRHNPEVPGWPSADGFQRYGDHSDGMLISSLI